VLGAANVPRLMSDKLAQDRETTRVGNLVRACVVTIRVAKSSNVSAPDDVSSCEVVAVKEMNDIGIDACASHVSSKIAKQPVGFGTDSVGASFAQKRLDGVRTRITMNLKGGDL
jgi:hypothetical protein